MVRSFHAKYHAKRYNLDQLELTLLSAAISLQMLHKYYQKSKQHMEKPENGNVINLHYLSHH